MSDAPPVSSSAAHLRAELKKRVRVTPRADGVGAAKQARGQAIEDDELLLTNPISGSTQAGNASTRNPKRAIPASRRGFRQRHGLHAALAGLVLFVLTGGLYLGSLGLGNRLSGADDSQAAQADYRALQLLEHAALVERPAFWQERAVSIGRGETVFGALLRLGADRDRASQAVAALTRLNLGANFRQNQRLTAYFDADERNRPTLAALTARTAPDESILLERSVNNDFLPRILKMDLRPDLRFSDGRIEGSLYASVRKAGASDREVDAFLDVFKYDVDFERDIQAGDRFQILFERLVDDRFETIKTGDLLFLALDTGSVDKKFYRFTTQDDGKTDFYDENGRSARKFLIRSPVNATRVSSGFGYRRHPILGYTKLHKGIDFAAPSGTPVVAAGDGIVVKAGFFGGYGRYVRIRHPTGLETAYAHLSSFARNIRPGARISQGQRIGAVGSSGNSTGPHLHYEILVKGKAVNPSAIKAQTGRQLSGELLDAFYAEKDRIEGLIAVRARASETSLAGSTPAPPAGQATPLALPFGANALP